MKVKTLIKTIKESYFQIINDYGSLLFYGEIDSEHNVYGLDGYKYIDFEFYENSQITDIHINNYCEDGFIIEIK